LGQFPIIAFTAETNYLWAWRALEDEERAKLHDRSANFSQPSRGISA